MFKKGDRVTERNLADFSGVYTVQEIWEDTIVLEEAIIPSVYGNVMWASEYFIKVSELTSFDRATLGIK